MFQSTPVISDGRIRSSPAQTRWGCGFNPRPSFLTGESLLVLRPRWMLMFQSTPVISDGRIPQGWIQGATLSCFNPRPSFLTGESGTTVDGAETLREFQSTPVISDGRILPVSA